MSSTRSLPNAKHPPLQHEIALGPIPLIGMAMAQRHVGFSCEYGALLVPDPNNPLTFVDIYFPDQTCSPGAVNFDPESVANFYDHFMNGEGAPFPNGFTPCWQHSHHNMGTTPSSTDEDTFSDTYGDRPYAIMLITNNAGQDYCRLRVSDPNNKFCVPITMTVAKLPGALDLIPPWLSDLPLKTILSNMQAQLAENVPQPYSQGGYNFSPDKLIKEVLKGKFSGHLPGFARFTSTLTRGECFVWLDKYLEWSMDQKADVVAATLWATYDGAGQPDRKMLDTLCQRMKKQTPKEALEAYAGEAKALGIFPIYQTYNQNGTNGYVPQRDRGGSTLPTGPVINSGSPLALTGASGGTSPNGRIGDVMRRHGLIGSGPTNTPTRAQNLLDTTEETRTPQA